ncbi:MAG: HEAT repeat domain-containing protein [Planctomycetaceae bacterium]|nr:HEAT repeat domain-containing protein [Planctomycetaceae bacterium]
MLLFAGRKQILLLVAVPFLGGVCGCSDGSANGKAKDGLSSEAAGELKQSVTQQSSRNLTDGANVGPGSAPGSAPGSGPSGPSGRAKIENGATGTAATEGQDGEKSLESLLDGLSRPIGGNSFAVSLNKRGAPAIPGLLQALQSEDATTRKNAAFCCGLTWSTVQAGTKISALTNVAENDADPKVRHQAAVAMAILARHEDVDPQLKVTIVPTLRGALQSASADTRSHLASVVGNMGHKGHPLIPAMITLLTDEDSSTRSKAAHAVGLLASPFPLERGKVVRDGDMPDYRASRESTELAVTALIAALSDTDPKVRAEAARGLSHIGRGADTAVPALTRQLADEETDSRLRAAEALVRVASDPSVAIPLLQDTATNDSSTPRLRWWKTRAQRLLEDLERSSADRDDRE